MFLRPDPIFAQLRFFGELFSSKTWANEVQLSTLCEEKLEVTLMHHTFPCQLNHAAGPSSRAENLENHDCWFSRPFTADKHNDSWHRLEHTSKYGFTGRWRVSRVLTPCKIYSILFPSHLEAPKRSGVLSFFQSDVTARTNKEKQRRKERTDYMIFSGKTRMDYKRRIRATNTAKIKNQNESTVEVEHQH